MEITTEYILSQIFTIITYVFLAATYYAKNRKVILTISFLSIVANGIAYVFLNAYTGLAMCIVALLRNIIFLVDEKKNGKRDYIDKKDVVILIVLYAISIISTFFTYTDFLSLLSVIATMLYTYSVWQKKTEVYKFLGIPIGILWVFYNIYIKSIFGIILETILLICSITGYLLEKKENKKVKEETENTEQNEN